MVEKAQFTEGHVPKGGTCISVFLVLRKKDRILVGKMAKPEIWVERFLVGEAFAKKYVSTNKWIIPSSHLIFGEKPVDAAQRVLIEQVATTENCKLSLLQVQSHLSQQPTNPENAHWDICFIYEGRVRGEITPSSWFSDLEFKKLRDLKSDDFTRGHGDVLTEIGIIMG